MKETFLKTKVELLPSSETSQISQLIIVSVTVNLTFVSFEVL